MIGLSGKCPGKKLSLIVTFFMATAETPGLYSITRSTRRKGNLNVELISQTSSFIEFHTDSTNHCKQKKTMRVKALPMWKNLTNLIDIEHRRESWKTYYEAAQICSLIFLVKKKYTFNHLSQKRLHLQTFPLHPSIFQSIFCKYLQLLMVTEVRKCFSFSLSFCYASSIQIYVCKNKGMSCTI